MGDFSGLEFRLYQLRDQNDWSKKELSEKLGFTTNTYGAYEKEKRRPDYETLVELSRLFNVSIDYLITGKEFHTKNNNIRSMQYVLTLFKTHGIQDPFILQYGKWKLLSKSDLESLQKYFQFLAHQAGKNDEEDV